MTHVAALPMYNVTPALAADWRAWLGDVLRAVDPQARIVDPGEDLQAFWRRPELLISQTCGYPLAKGLHHQVQLIATPHFDAPGCHDANYSSVIVTHAAAPFTTLATCRGARAAYNQDDSNSGMNVFRHAIAPLAKDGRFFSAALRTGSHLDSLHAIARNHADVAAIDCVTYALVCDTLPELAQQVRVLDWSAASPGLPLIASHKIAPATIEALRAALHDATRTQPERAARLRLKGFSALTLRDYARITQLEDQAQALSYPNLA
jgi:ABC-type phosphate/phosphonate transport system substrate-binding protein